jgi:uncharacterized protein (DUF1330 family)
MAKAYVLANIEVHDPETNARYRERARPIVEQYGGRYIIRGPKVEALEGDFGLDRLVVLEFPSAQAARTWYHSPEYQEVMKLRLASATSDLVLIEGFDG